MTKDDSLETGKIDDPNEPPKHLLAFCTYTGKRVITKEWRQTEIMKDEAIWWKCPACEDWHITLMRRKDDW